MPRTINKRLVAADDAAVLLDENEVTAAIDVSGASQITFWAAGTFGGGTVTWQFSPDGGTTWITTGLTTAANGKADLAFPATLVRGSLAGATSPSLACGVLMRTYD